MFYSPAAGELRAFLRDKLGLAHFDVGGGWLIFTPPSSEVGCHEAEENKQDISFYCDDIYETVSELKGKGVVFTAEVEDHGYGLVTYFEAPGGLVIQLYQPKYAKP